MSGFLHKSLCIADTSPSLESQSVLRIQAKLGFGSIVNQLSLMN